MTSLLAALALLASPPTPRVGTFTSKPFVFETNSYWIEGPTGVVLIDTQFLPGPGLRAAAAAEAATGKKVVLAIVLHANPDKFNGAAALQARGIRVVTSAQVSSLIPAVHALRKSWFFDRYGPDYPADAPTLDVFGDVTHDLDVAGLTLRLHVFGAACSRAHVVVEIAGHLFVGDMVASGSHAWTELGLLSDWQLALERLAGLRPRVVHPGRGPSGGPELISAQAAYLDWVADRVRAEHPKGEPSSDVLALLAADVEAHYPGYAYSHFVKVGLPALWRTLSSSGPALSAQAAPTFRVANGLVDVSLLSAGASALDHLVARPGAVVPEHVHETSDELIYVISGRALMTLEGHGEFEVSAGMGVLIPRGRKHSMQVPASAGEPLVAIQVYAPAGPEERFRAGVRLR